MITQAVSNCECTTASVVGPEDASPECSKRSSLAKVQRHGTKHKLGDDDGWLTIIGLVDVFDGNFRTRTATCGEEGALAARCSGDVPKARWWRIGERRGILFMSILWLVAVFACTIGQLFLLGKL
jgi:hypothetical protein